MDAPSPPGGPLGWALSRARRRRGRPGGSGGARSGSAGPRTSTEAAAAAALRRNARDFSYPPGGFVHPIERSLLYSMLGEPGVYPPGVVGEHIDGEDLGAYLAVRGAHGAGAGAGAGAGGGGVRGAGGEDEEEEEDSASYAQLGALLALAAEKFPPGQAGGDDEGGGGERDPGQADVPRRLCRAVLRTVVRYAERNGLDREAELRELLDPVERRARRRSNGAAWRQILPFYVGYAASLVTANPLPMLLGAGFMVGGDAKKAEDEGRNHEAISQHAERSGDVERAGLLDEAEDGWE